MYTINKYQINNMNNLFKTILAFLYMYGYSNTVVYLLHFSQMVSPSTNRMIFATILSLYINYGVMGLVSHFTFALASIFIFMKHVYYDNNKNVNELVTEQYGAHIADVQDMFKTQNFVDYVYDTIPYERAVIEKYVERTNNVVTSISNMYDIVYDSTATVLDNTIKNTCLNGYIYVPYEKFVENVSLVDSIVCDTTKMITLVADDSSMDDINENTENIYNNIMNDDFGKNIQNNMTPEEFAEADKFARQLLASFSDSFANGMSNDVPNGMPNLNDLLSMGVPDTSNTFNVPVLNESSDDDVSADDDLIVANEDNTGENANEEDKPLTPNSTPIDTEDEVDVELYADATDDIDDNVEDTVKDEQATDITTDNIEDEQSID